MELNVPRNYFRSRDVREVERSRRRWRRFGIAMSAALALALIWLAAH
jgi:hypothetical protein